ncbi:MAG: hypothetical protein AABW73_02530 [Nanoarchaeota archaeon]
MEKAEIMAGLKSALSRGYSLEFSKKSFINAGYSSQDVDDSAAALMAGGSSIANSRPAPPSGSYQAPSIPQSSPSTPAQNPGLSSAPKTPATMAYQQLPSSSSSSQSVSYKPLPKPASSPSDYKRLADVSGTPKAHGLGLVIFLTLILLIVLGVLGLFIFKKDLVEATLRGWGLI